MLEENMLLGPYVEYAFPDGRPILSKANYTGTCLLSLFFYTEHFQEGCQSIHCTTPDHQDLGFLQGIGAGKPCKQILTLLST